MDARPYRVKRSENITTIRHDNGDRIVLFNARTDGHPIDAFLPENWADAVPLGGTRHAARVTSMGRTLVLKDIIPTRAGNTLFSESRILENIEETGEGIEEPLAVVIRPGHLPVHVTSFVEGTTASGADADTVRYRLFQKGITIHDLIARNVKKDREGLPRVIDAEAAQLRDMTPPSTPEKKPKEVRAVRFMDRLRRLLVGKRRSEKPPYRFQPTAEQRLRRMRIAAVYGVLPHSPRSKTFGRYDPAKNTWILHPSLIRTLFSKARF